MLRQIASIAALAIVATPMMALAQTPETEPVQATQQQHKECYKIYRDGYKYEEEGHQGDRYWDSIYVNWHSEKYPGCAKDNYPYYMARVITYYGEYRYESDWYSGKESKYTFKVPKRSMYKGMKPDYMKIEIKVRGDSSYYMSEKLYFRK